jgi:uncharacterized protein (TIGR03084 family)
MTPPAANPQADDFLAECRVLHDLLSAFPAQAWEEPTGFKDWTAVDIVGHLHHSDRTAVAALDGEDAFWRQMTGLREAAERGESGIAYTRRWHGLSGPALLDLWIESTESLAATYRDVNPRRRIYWGRGPDMSARSCISARQMEVWSHGQALFDHMGRDRPESDKLRNVAQICTGTFGWAFRVRGLPVPERPPYVQIVAPSGAIWEWNDPASPDRIFGSAVEFCQVGTQTRNIADTALRVEGETARQWMAIAQCFAGAPHDPPLPGVRCKLSVV